MSDIGTSGQLIVDLIELDKGADEPFVRIEGYAYVGVMEHPSTGLMSLAIIKPGGSRRQFIEVGQIIAITVGGLRHELEVPPERGKVRGQEIVRLIEGQFSEDWAFDYFDPESPKYYGYSRLESLALQGVYRDWISLDLDLDTKLTKRVQIEYDGRDGETVRIIKPISVGGKLTFDPPNFIITEMNARCELRKATRTFLMASIGQEVVDAETGEIVGKQVWAQSLPLETQALNDLLKCQREFGERFGKRRIGSEAVRPITPEPKSRMDEAAMAVAGKSTGCLMVLLGPIGLIIGCGGWFMS